MGVPSTAYPNSGDAFNAVISDPAVALAVNALESNLGFDSQSDTLANVLTRSFASEDLLTSTVTLTAGSVLLFKLDFMAGWTINKLTFLSAATGVSTPTNAWAGITTIGTTGLKVSAISADGLTTAWAADTFRTFSLGTPLPIPTTASYYGFICVAATTGPTLAATVTTGSHGRGNVTPYLAGIGDTGKTTPFAVAASITAPSSSLAKPACWVN